eukprot:gene7043-7106_t
MLALLLPLGACANVDRTVTGSTVPDDYRQRHPIVMAAQAQQLDIFILGDAGRVDTRQSADLQSFAAMYRARGQGQITVLVPSNVSPHAAQATLKTIRERLNAAGVKGYIRVGNYVPEQPDLAAPIHLSFEQVVARVNSRCGEWPADLASGSSAQGWQNRPYYNLGCSTQANLAAQIADPVDLVRPRQEDPSDVQMRTRAISSVRAGVDPGTAWTTTNTNIGGLGN